MLSPGDQAPSFDLSDQTGKRFFLQDAVGSPLLLLFHGSEALEPNREILKAFESVWEEYQKAGIQVVSISPDSPSQRASFLETHPLTFPTLSDPGYTVSQRFGIVEVDSLTGELDSPLSFTVVFLNQNLVILDMYGPFAAEHIPALLQIVTTHCPKQSPIIVTDAYTPPVLLIPNVFDPATCRDIIEVWETQGNQESHFMRSNGERTYGVVDHRIKIRRDHFIRDETIKNTINRIFQKRVYPEMKKCFQAEVFEYEHFKIACYDAQTGGYFRPHRDNTSGGTSHRQWAMSLNLNSEEYEGGYLRFPEYGTQLYKPDTGSAVIFSCSLMHEATDVTQGKRFVLLSFFYGEKESRSRQSYREKYGTADYVPKEVLESNTALKKEKDS